MSSEISDMHDHLGLVSQLGLTMVAAIGIGLAAGHGLDRWLGLGGVGKVVGIPLGVAAGFWAAYTTIVQTCERAQRRQR